MAVRLTEAGAAAAARAEAARRDGLRRVLAGLPAKQAAGLAEALELLLTEVYGDVGSEDVLSPALRPRRLPGRGPRVPGGAGRARRADRARRAG